MKPAIVAAGSVVVLAIMLWFTWPGLHSYFNDDDIMNLRKALGEPTVALIQQTFTFSPDGYRPVGLLWYKAMLGLAGLHPPPYRVFSFLILVLNLILLCAFALTLTRSVEVMLLAALFGCYHSRMSELYFSPPHIFELLCYAFYFGALLIYIRLPPDCSISRGVRLTLLLLLLQTLALGAKEMAVTLPVMLLVYELVYRRRWRYAGICLACSFAISLLFCFRKVVGATLLNEAYHPTYSVRFVLENWQHYLALMLYRNDSVDLMLVVAVWIALAIIAIGLRSKALMVCCAFVFIAPLPVLFVAPRSLDVLYISMTGWAIFLACVVVTLRERLAYMIGHPQVTQAAVFVAIAALLCIAHYRDRPDHTFPPGGRVQLIQPFLESLIRFPIPLPPDAHILLLDDPFPPDQWFASMILQLYYRQPELEVLRSKVPDQKASIDQRVNVVLTWTDGRLIPAANYIQQLR